MTKGRAVLSSYMGVLVFSSVLFLGAGKLLFWQGLLYVGLAVLGTTLTHLLQPSGSTLAEDRAREAQEGQAWDKRLLGQIFLASLVSFLVAGLDVGRFGWTGDVPLGVTALGVALMLLGQTLFALARRENAFFSSTVRVQTERGHQVCDTGLYRVVRHPGYLGMGLSQLAFPLVLGSAWALIPAGIGLVLLGVRTVREDHFLQEALEGYPAYAQRTRWRILPGLF